MKDLQAIKLKHNERTMKILKCNEVLPKERSEFYLPIGETLGYVSAMNFLDDDWEHVMLNGFWSNRCPTYEEMTLLKDTFWTEGEIAIQVHPRKSEYINKCEYTLHLWRNRNVSEKVERGLRQRIEKMLEKAKEFYEKGQRKEILLEEDTKVVLIFCGDRWLTWEEVCQIKQKYWQPEEAAVQFNISQAFDLNKERIIMLWDAEDFDLPLKEYV